jgi:hypothetical protein
VQVARVDTFKKQVDFQLAVEERKPIAARNSDSRQTSRPQPARPQLGRSNQVLLKTSIRSFSNKSRRR